MEMDELMRLAGLPGGGIQQVAPDLEEMSDKEREEIPKRDFVFPDDRSWPINDLEHGKIALDWARRGFRVKKGSRKAREIIDATAFLPNDPLGVLSWKLTFGLDGEEPSFNGRSAFSASFSGACEALAASSSRRRLRRRR